MDSGASGIYYIPTAPVDNLNLAAPQIRVGTDSGGLAYSLASAQVALSQIPSYFTESFHVIADLNHYLMGLGSICDAECSVHFHKFTVKIYDSQGIPLIQVWQDKKIANLRRFSLQPQNSITSSADKYGQAFTVVPNSKSSYLQAFSAYNLPGV